MPLRNGWSDKVFAARSVVTNPFRQEKLVYVIEAKGWAIRYVGQCVTAQLRHESGVSAALSTTGWALRNKIVHFGSLHTILQHGRPRVLHPSNQYVLSVFHLIPEKPGNAFLSRLVPQLAAWHTSSQTTKQQLLALGVPESRVTVIPLGVDTTLFAPAKQDVRLALRRRLGIAAEAFVIGSFQKDGVGWGAGIQPKLEKGPDVFVKVIQGLAPHYPLHVLLVGPARGYVVRALQAQNIPYTNIGYLPKVVQVASYYAALDAYLITSRIEGGPLALLEAWASGVPTVSTMVGMAADIATDGVTALLAPVDDVAQLTHHLRCLIERTELRRRLATAARAHVGQYQWSEIVEKYFIELYQPLLSRT